MMGLSRNTAETTFIMGFIVGIVLGAIIGFITGWSNNAGEGAGEGALLGAICVTIFGIIFAIKYGQPRFWGVFLGGIGCAICGAIGGAIIGAIGGGILRNPNSYSSSYSSGKNLSNVAPINPIVSSRETWVCKECGEANPITSLLCKGCGEYK
jgi:hypothetical protein